MSDGARDDNTDAYDDWRSSAAFAASHASMRSLRECLKNNDVFGVPDMGAILRAQQQQEEQQQQQEKQQPADANPEGSDSSSSSAAAAAAPPTLPVLSAVGVLSAATALNDDALFASRTARNPRRTLSDLRSLDMNPGSANPGGGTAAAGGAGSVMMPYRSGAASSLLLPRRILGSPHHASRGGNNSNDDDSYGNVMPSSSAVAGAASGMSSLYGSALDLLLQYAPPVRPGASRAPAAQVRLDL